MRKVITGLVAGAAMLAAACGSGTGGGAAPEPAGPNRAPTDVVAAAEQRLGASFAGGFVDPTGAVVVLTTDPATADEVRALGASPEVVQHSKAELADWQSRVSAALGPRPPTSVTYWGIDVARNAVVVHVLSTEPVPPELQQVVDDAAGAVVLAEAAGPVVPMPGG